jgi:hypothetical protein
VKIVVMVRLQETASAKTVNMKQTTFRQGRINEKNKAVPYQVGMIVEVVEILNHSHTAIIRVNNHSRETVIDLDWLDL